MAPLTGPTGGRLIEAWAERWGVPAVHAFGETRSTNDVLRQLAENGVASHTVVIAEQQSAGRGRRGSSWYSPPACGLWLSFLAAPRPTASAWREGIGPGSTAAAIVGTLPLLAGLAAARAIDEAVDARVGLEWPNDLDVRGHKVGGILCESVGARVIIGVGVNLNEPEDGFPPELLPRAGSVQGPDGEPIDRLRVAETLVRGLVRLTKSAGPELADEAHAEIVERDVLRDRLVETEQHGRGVARGITRAGALELEREDGERVLVVAGSVRAVDPRH